MWYNRGMKESKAERARTIYSLLLDYMLGALAHPFRQKGFRMEAKDWKQILLAHKDRVFLNGEAHNMVAVSKGYGVVEIHLEEWLVCP